MQYGLTQNNLGTAYGTLAEVEDKAANCRKAIAAFEAALKVITRERFSHAVCHDPEQPWGCLLPPWRMVEDKAANCRKAIAAFEAALTVITRERFPMQYGLTQNNLGNAYRTLAEVEDKAANSHKAIAAYKAALTVYNPGALSHAVCHDPEQPGGCLRHPGDRWRTRRPTAIRPLPRMRRRLRSEPGSAFPCSMA